MRVLVTGATGFTGAALVRRLLDAEHEVIGIDKQKGLFYDELVSRGANVVLGSVTDRDLIRKCMQGVQVVHHVAAAFREMDVPRDYYTAVNVDGTRNVVEEAAEAGVVRLIYCSTCGVHGNVNQPPASENAPIAPADYYQQTKYEGELVVQEFARKGLPTVVLRPAAIYGPGDPERFFMIFQRVAKRVFPMFGDGKTFYHPLYIDNLVDAFMLAMEKQSAVGGTFLIADEHYHTIEELVRAVARAIGVDVRIVRLPLTPLIVAGHIMEKACRPFGIVPPLFPRRVDWYRQHRAFDCSAAKQLLGYQPRVDLDEGLANTARWYRQNGFLAA